MQQGRHPLLEGGDLALAEIAVLAVPVEIEQQRPAFLVPMQARQPLAQAIVPIDRLAVSIELDVLGQQVAQQRHRAAALALHAQEQRVMAVVVPRIGLPAAPH
ncbi:hypothetical protein [Pseudomonas aeruginosa]|uniref:hypothetical protein n=1 Tax=Pseudomonas aeruginosa TaxID=287 RepID=UPI00208F9EA5